MLKMYCPCPRKTLNLTWLISDRKSCADTCSILPFVKKKKREKKRVPSEICGNYPAWILFI